MARPRILETPLSAAERKRRQREKSACHETCHETQPAKPAATAKAREILDSVGADDWDDETRKLVAAKLLATMACDAGIGGFVAVFIMERIGRQRVEAGVSE
jgi:hypothetical protein